MSTEQDYNRSFAGVCRMAEKQLEQLNGEIAELNKIVKAAEDDWLSATDPQRKADLWHVYAYRKNEKEELLKDRRALQAKLPGASERTLLCTRVSSTRHYGFRTGP